MLHYIFTLQTVQQSLEVAYSSNIITGRLSLREQMPHWDFFGCHVRGLT